MKRIRIGLTIVLLLFVGATVGTLIAQEASRPVAPIAEGSGTALSASGGMPVDSPASTPAAEAPTERSVEEVAAADESAALPGEADAAEEAGAAGEDHDEIVPAEEDRAAEPCVVDAIYFHNTHRCFTCLRIESQAREIAEREFAGAFASGRLRWSAINMEDETRYIERYDLAMPTLVLVRSIGGEPQDWVSLGETWALIRSSSRFAAYISDSFRAFLEGCP